MPADHTPPDDEEPPKLFKPAILSPGVLLIDNEASCGVFACLCENIRPKEFDPGLLVTSDYVRVLILTGMALMDDGLLVFPSSYGSAAECHRIARVNAELICHQIDLAGIWPAGSETPRWIARECLEMQSLPWLADYYVWRLEVAARRRHSLERALELQKQALSPLPPEVSDAA
jgi:hypothetical protein